MTTKAEILDAALDVLGRGEVLTLDSAAREAGLTKPGVVHHFPTKERLSFAVLDHLLDRWEQQLHRRAGTDPSPVAKLRAYVDHALLGDMDASDLALLADPRLREGLSARWVERMDAWFGEADDPRHAAARLVADGAWFDRCLGMLDLDEPARAATAALVAELIGEEASS